MAINGAWKHHTVVLDDFALFITHQSMTTSGAWKRLTFKPDDFAQFIAFTRSLSVAKITRSPSSSSYCMPMLMCDNTSLNKFREHANESWEWKITLICCGNLLISKSAPSRCAIVDNNSVRLSVPEFSDIHVKF